MAFRPPCALCYVPRPKVLNGENLPDEPDSCHKDICLSLAGRSFKFLTPGRYRVRASYRYHDTVLVSNILELYVRYPTPEVENLVVPLLDEDVATYLAFRGVAGLSRARERLREKFLADDGSPRPDVSHPLMDYFFAYEAMIRANDSDSSGERGGDDRRWFARALGMADLRHLRDARRRTTVNLAGLPFSNIALGKIGGRIYDAFKDAPRQGGLAKTLSRKLHDALQARGVPQHIRHRYLPPQTQSGRA